MTIVHTDVPLLTADEEGALAERIEAGVLAADALARADLALGSEAELSALVRDGEQAWEQFLLANVRLVQREATAASLRSQVAVDELFQEGFIGLALALRRWDHRRGLKFSTFALAWIRRLIDNRALMGAGERPAGSRTMRRIRGLQMIESRLTQQLGRLAQPAEVAEVAGFTTRRAERLLAQSRHQQLGSIEPAVEVDQEDDLIDDLGRVLWRLSADEREVVRLRYGFTAEGHLSQPEVATRLGVAERTVRRRERQAIDRLRELLSEQRAVA